MRLPRDPLHRLLAINAASGIALAILVVAALLWLDIGRLATLIGRDEAPLIALFLMTGGFIVTVASVMMGSAIMMLGDRERQKTSPPHLPSQGLRAVPVKAEARSRGRAGLPRLRHPYG